MQPNILFLHSHKSGYFIEPYGHAVPTPDLMRLVRLGAPSCSPSGGSEVGRRATFCQGPARQQSVPLPLLAQAPFQGTALGHRYEASPRPAPEPKREPQPPFSGTNFPH